MDVHPLSVLLVHGAWHGAWCWDQVREGLRQRGVTSFAPELPLTGFADNARALLDAIEDVPGPMIVCAHSGAGNLLTEVGSVDTRVEHLVYLAAMMLDEGERQLVPRRPTLVSEAVDVHDGLSTVNPELARELFYGDCSLAESTAAVARLRPVHQDDSGWMPSGRPAAWRVIPATYVVCSRDRSIHPDDQRHMASGRASRIVEWESSHSPFLCQPQLVVDLLAGLAFG